MKFCEMFTDSRQRVKARELMQWVFGKHTVEDSHNKEDWKRFLGKILHIVMNLKRQGRWTEYKMGGKVGELTHDYGVTEIAEKGAVGVPMFKCMLNKDY